MQADADHGGERLRFMRGPDALALAAGLALAAATLIAADAAHVATGAAVALAAALARRSPSDAAGIALWLAAFWVPLAAMAAALGSLGTTGFSAELAHLIMVPPAGWVVLFAAPLGALLVERSGRAAPLLFLCAAVVAGLPPTGVGLLDALAGGLVAAVAGALLADRAGALVTGARRRPAVAAMAGLALALVPPVAAVTGLIAVGPVAPFVGLAVAIALLLLMAFAPAGVRIGRRLGAALLVVPAVAAGLAAPFGVPAGVAGLLLALLAARATARLPLLWRPPVPPVRGGEGTIVRP